MLTGCGDRLHNKFISKTFPLLSQDQWANKSEPCQNKKHLCKGQVPGPPWIGHKPHVGLQMVYERPSMKSGFYFCILFGRFVHRPHLTKISISNNTWVLPLNIYIIYIYIIYIIYILYIYYTIYYIYYIYIIYILYIYYIYILYYIYIYYILYIYIYLFICDYICI